MTRNNVWGRQQAAWTALNGAAAQLESSYGATASKVIDYGKARDGIKSGGALGPSPTGENWNMPSDQKARSYDEVTEEQKVGDNTKLKDLFRDKKGGESTDVQGIDRKSLDSGTAKERANVSKLFEEARMEDNKVLNAVSAYKRHAGDPLTEKAERVKEATAQLDLGKAEGDEEAQGKKDKLEADKEVIEFLTAGIGALGKLKKLQTDTQDLALEAAARSRTRSSAACTRPTSREPARRSRRQRPSRMR